MHGRLPSRCLLGVALIAGCVLALQVLLTRLFSAALYYHFSFLSISLALLGAGAGGILVYVRPAWFSQRPLEQELARWSAVLAGLLVVVPLVVVRIKFAGGAEITMAFTAQLGLLSLVTTTLFGAAGTVIALAVRGYTHSLPRLYAFDLAGAALGAVVMVPLMWAVPVPVLVIALSPVAAIAGLLFASVPSTADQVRRSVKLGVGALAVGVTALVAASTTDLYRLAPTDRLVAVSQVSDTWTPLSRVLGYGEIGDSGFAPMFYDRVYAPVAVYRRGRPIPDWRRLSLGPQTLGYELGGRDKALVIGGGGGRDILNALSSGVRSVDVIELNKGIRDTVDGPMRRWSGAPYSLPHVHTRVGDGRSLLAQSSEKYDVVHMGFTDTLSANSAQAFALTENNLYTTEAFEEFLAHLKPNGVLAVSRPYRLVGDEALRATILTLAALRHHGIAHPERNVVVVLGSDILPGLSGTVLAKRTPWTPAQLRRLRVLARERGKGIAYAPGGPYRLEWADLAKASSPEAFCASYRFDVCAPTDDKPFFFQMRRLGNLGPQGAKYAYTIDPFIVLLLTFGVLTVLSLALIAAPLAFTARARRPPVSSLGFFVAIGLGFLVLEVALIQRFVLFLGFPTYALSVVLFALLLSTGVGSLLADRIREPRRALSIALTVTCILIAGSVVGLAPLLSSLIGLPFATRVGVTVALLAPMGIAMGMAMPLGLGRLATLHPSGVPWAWGVNGVASVVASVLGVTVAILAGFTVATLVALGCYLVALADARFAPWPERAAQRGSGWRRGDPVPEAVGA